MNKGFKKTIVLIMIVTCGSIYMSEKKWFSGISSMKYNISGNNKSEMIEDGNKPLLVNSKKMLDEKYIPEGLAKPNIQFSDTSDDDERKMAKIAIKPLEDLVNNAKEQGIILIGNSAYRSYVDQKKLYKDSIKSHGKKYTSEYVAKPGSSEHQTGLAIDITNEQRCFTKGTPEADWLAKNCYKFGFIIRYPEDKKDITGIAYEPWHIRYVGKEVAKYIHDNKITLEEYLEKNEKG